MERRCLDDGEVENDADGDGDGAGSGDGIMIEIDENGGGMSWNWGREVVACFVFQVVSWTANSSFEIIHRIISAK